MGAADTAATKSRMVRLFTALSVPDDVAGTLAHRQTGLPGANWRTHDQLHITLTFYGEIDEHRADDLAVELEKAAAGGPFQIALAGVGAFGDGHRTRTLWAGIEPNQRLSVLAGRCRTAAERAGITVERRDYHPHLTLAYLKQQTNPDRIGAWIAGNNLLHSPPVLIDRFGLYSSALTQDGSHYELEREYLL